MLNICFVKFGDKVQGFNANELLYDMIIPIIENIKEPFKIWVATDEPIEVFIDDERATDLINYIPLTNQDIKEHGHWTKIFFFDPSYIKAKEGDTTVIMDIDMQWKKDPSPVLTYPVEHGDFVSMDRWWKSDPMPISGNLYKFNSHDFKFVYDNYMEDYKKHKKYYYENKIVQLPQEGEQYFVYDQIKDKSPWFNVKLQPAEWCMKIHLKNEERQKMYEDKFKEVTGKEYGKCIFDAIWTYENIK